VRGLVASEAFTAAELNAIDGNAAPLLPRFG
jgi:hypothetical protein